MLTWSQRLRWVHPAQCWVYSAAPSAGHWPLHPAVRGKKSSYHIITTRSTNRLTRPLNLFSWLWVWVLRQAQGSNLARWWPSTHSARHLCGALPSIQVERLTSEHSHDDYSPSHQIRCQQWNHWLAHSQKTVFFFFGPLILDLCIDNVLSESFCIVTSNRIKAYCQKGLKSL